LMLLLLLLLLLLLPGSEWGLASVQKASFATDAPTRDRAFPPPPLCISCRISCPAPWGRGETRDSAFAKSCGKCHRFDKYLVLEIYNFKKGSSDKLAKKS
uniref:Uncharacterized protein n=2 Tax=Equus TaxID=9789 RepID=A0A3Q2L909_HORSE